VIANRMHPAGNSHALAGMRTAQASTVVGAVLIVSHSFS